MPRMVWPFMPVGEVNETLAWMTDVLHAKSAEQRIQLRQRPRRAWHFRHVFSAEQAAAARAIVRAAAADGYWIPDWISPVFAGPVPSGAAVLINVPTAGLDLEVGASVLVMAGVSSFEVCEISALDSSSFTLSSVSSSRTGAQIWRLDAAHGEFDLSIDRQAGGAFLVSAQFDGGQAVDCVADAPTQYRGHDLLSDIPVVGAGSLDEGISWPISLADYGLSPAKGYADRSMPNASMSMRWHVFGNAAKRALRTWLFRRKGRALAFWRSSMAADMVAASGIDSAATTLNVFAPDGAEGFGETAFDVEINGMASYLRRVTNASPGAPVDGRATVDLTLDAALGTTHTAAQIGRISFLRCLRFDADRVELLHAPGGGMQVAVPCVEVPVP